MGVENFPLISLVFGEGEFGDFQLKGVAPGCHCVFWMFWEKCSV